MPSPERGGGSLDQPDQQPATEHEPTPYQRAARCAADRPAMRAYTQAQDAVFTTDCDLSVYRLLIDQVSHVAVVGTAPPPALDARLARILATGEPVALPATVVQQLLERRAQARRQGPWVERHYRPGKPL